MTIKERIVRIDAYDGLFDKKDLSNPEAVDAYYNELIEHERSINNTEMADALEFTGNMACDEVGAGIGIYATTDECKRGYYEHMSNYNCAFAAAYIISRVMQDESYNELVKPVDPRQYYNTSGIMDASGKAAFEEDCADRQRGLLDMSNMMISETMNDDDALMSLREEFDIDAGDDIDDIDDSEFENMSDRELLIEMVKTLHSIKMINYEIMKTVVTLR